MTSRSKTREIPVPAVIAQGGRRGWVAAVVGGVILGGLTLIVPSLLSRGTAFGMLAILLGMIASVYVGFALNDGRFLVFQVEYVGIVIFATLAVLALARGSATILALGYVGHAAWDVSHHKRAIDLRMPSWYVPVCIGYDVVVAVYVLARF